jgi:O-antigen ligase
MRLALTVRPDAPASPRTLAALALLALGALAGVLGVVTASGDALWAGALVVALVGGGIVALAPALGVLLIFGFHMFKYPEWVYDLPITPNRALALLLVVVLAGAIVMRRRFTFHRTPTYVGLVLVTGAVVLNSFFVGTEEGPGSLASLDMTGRMATGTLSQFLYVTLFCAFLRTRRHLAWMVGLFLATLFITIPGALTHTYDIAALGEQSLERARALATTGIQSAENANRLAFVAALGISFVWFAVQHYRSRVLRMAAWFALPVLVLTIFLSGSRSGVLNLGLLVALLALQSGVRPGRLAAVGLIVLLAVGMVWFVVPQQIFDRITSFLPSEDVTSATRSSELRQLMLAIGWQLFRDSPFVGIGVGNVRWMAALHPESAGLGLTMHNNYMLVLVEGGIVLLAAYLLLFWLTWRSLQRCARRAGAGHEIGLGWLVRATRTNLLLLLAFSLFAEPWREFYFVLILGFAAALAAAYASPPPAPPRSANPRWLPSPSST